jgi:two-component system, chemotaxis family, chemotaxis protein CheY
MAVDTLIVDDSEATRELLKRRLGGIGCNIVGEAANAAEALRLFKEKRPRLVTLDLMMPVVEGIDAKELLRRIRDESPDVAIFVVSSVPKETERAELMKAGASDYIQKPFINFNIFFNRLKYFFPELK